VSDNFASTYGVRPGDVIALPASSGPRQLKVIGTYDDPSWPRGTVVINRIRKFESGEISSCLALGGGLAGWRLKDRKDAGDFAGGLADYFEFSLPPGTGAATARDPLQQLPWAAEESLIGVTRPELRGHISAMVEKLSDLTFSQRLMIGLVAALG